MTMGRLPREYTPTEETFRCKECGYDLTGTAVGGVCPECGLSVNASLQSRIDKKHGDDDGLTTGPLITRTAIISLVTGVLSLLVCFLLGPYAVYMGLRAIRAMSDQPDMTGSRVVAMLGIALGFLSLILFMFGLLFGVAPSGLIFSMLQLAYWGFPMMWGWSLS